METVQTVSLAVIAVSTLVLAVFVLALLFGIYMGVRRVNGILQDVRDAFGPLAEEMKQTAQHANEVAERLLDEADGFTDSVGGVRRRAERLGALVEVLEEDLENATVKLLAVLGGLAGMMGRAGRTRESRSDDVRSPEGAEDDE